MDSILNNKNVIIDNNVGKSECFINENYNSFIVMKFSYSTLKKMCGLLGRRVKVMGGCNSFIDSSMKVLKINIRKYSTHNYSKANSWVKRKNIYKERINLLTREQKGFLKGVFGKLGFSSYTDLFDAGNLLE